MQSWCSDSAGTFHFSVLNVHGKTILQHSIQLIGKKIVLLSEAGIEPGITGSKPGLWLGMVTCRAAPLPVVVCHSSPGLTGLVSEQHNQLAAPAQTTEG